MNRPLDQVTISVCARFDAGLTTIAETGAALETIISRATFDRNYSDSPCGYNRFDNIVKFATRKRNELHANQ